MRNWFFAFFLVLAALAGYALAPRTVQAQQPHFIPFLPGQTILLTFESGRNQQGCTVTMLRDEFIGCTTERTPGREEREVWYNLRFVERIDKRER